MRVLDGSENADNWLSSVTGILGDDPNSPISNLVILRDPLIVSQGQITFNAEGNDNSASNWFSRQLHFPGKASGVTIGRGYDMGGRTSAQVTQDLINAGMDSGTAVAYAQGAGLHKNEAQDFVTNHKDILPPISREVQNSLFSDVTYPSYASGAQTSYERAISGKKDATAWSDLDSKVKDVAIDFYYQQGRIYKTQMSAIIKNDPKSLATSLLNDERTSQHESARGRAPYLRRN